MADAIRHTRRRAPSVLWTAVRGRGSVLAAVVPELALEVSLRPPPLDAPVVFETLLDAAVEAAGTAGLVWVVEDLHWADEATWRFVAYAAARVGRLPLVLSLTYRDEEVPPSHPRWFRLATLRREPDVTSLPLGRLNPAKTREMLAAVFPAMSRFGVGPHATGPDRRAPGMAHNLPVPVHQLRRWSGRTGGHERAYTGRSWVRA